MNTRFEQSLSQGKAGESLISQWLIKRGIHVLPVYEKIINEYKGPVLYTYDNQLIAPDLFCFNSDKHTVFWVEAKHKTAFSWYRKHEIWTTGIDTHHFEQYLQVRELLQHPIYLMFLQQGGQAKDSPEVSPSGLFGGEIIFLSENIHHTYGGENNYGKGGMTYWDKNDLRKYAAFEEIIECGYPF